MPSILDAALEYLDRGFSVIPVNRADKKPYVKWQEFTKRLPTEDELYRWWEVWPNANVAIICGSISGIWAVDADGPAGIDWMTANLPKTGAYSITAKGLHAIYLAPKGTPIRNAVRLAPEVDIRGDGGYIVAPPSKHQSGHEYRWQFLMDGWDDLAVFDPSNIVPKKSGNLNLDLSRISQPVDTEAIAAGVPKGERDNMIFREACRLRALNLSEHEAWDIIKAAAARCNPPFPESDALKKMQQAWKYEAGTADAETVEVCSDVEPEDCTLEDHGEDDYHDFLRPGGILQMIMDHIDANSAVSFPLFSLAAAVTTLGAVIGQKVQTETGLRTNIYSIALGYSGSGKDAPFNVINQIIGQTDASKIMGPTEITSAPSVLRWLSKPDCHISLFMVDEIGQLLNGLKNPNNSAAGLPRMLTQLFSSTNRPQIKNYANGDELIVHYHHLSLYGVSTPNIFWDSLTTGEVADGFLARVLLWQSHHEAEMPKATRSFDVDKVLLTAINELYAIQPPKKGDIGPPDPFIIPKTEDAAGYFNPWAAEYHNLKNKYRADRSGPAPIYGRAAEHAHKLALIHAMSIGGPGTKAVGLESVKWACALIDRLIKSTVIQVSAKVCDDETVRLKQKIISWIRAKAKEGKKRVSRNDLMRGPLQIFKNKQQADQLIETMIIAKQLGAETVSTGGRPATVYFVAKQTQ